MFTVRLHAVCEARGDRHDFTEQGERAAKRETYVDAIDEKLMRELLAGHVQNFVDVTGCTEPSGYSRLWDEVPEKKLRAGIHPVRYSESRLHAASSHL